MFRIDLWEENIPLYNSEYLNGQNENCPTLDCYISEVGVPRPAVLVIPGGGYDHRAAHEGKDVAEEFLKNGINAFVLNYRVLPYTYPAIFYDALRAIRLIRSNAEKFCIIPEKTAVIGFSAGAHLAGMLAEHYDETDYPHTDEADSENARPDALILCYPVSSLTDEYRHEGSAEKLTGGNEELQKKLSLDTNVRSDMPPVFMWHTVEDRSVNCNNSLRLASALKEKDIPFEYHLFPDGKHGLGLAEGIDGTDQWFGLMINWLTYKAFGI